MYYLLKKRFRKVLRKISKLGFLYTKTKSQRAMKSTSGVNCDPVLFSWVLNCKCRSSNNSHVAFWNHVCALMNQPTRIFVYKVSSCALLSGDVSKSLVKSIFKSGVKCASPLSTARAHIWCTFFAQPAVKESRKCFAIPKCENRENVFYFWTRKYKYLFILVSNLVRVSSFISIKAEIYRKCFFNLCQTLP